MSSIKLSPNASGTGEFTIAAPNSNTNRTLTLPDQTGTVLTNAGPYTANASTPNGAVTADASGNIGIGVTPASFATVKALQLNTTGTVFSFTDELDIAQNVYYNAGNKYITSAAASMYVQAGGQHLWYRAASGTAGNAINFSENGRFNTSGAFLVGTTNSTGDGGGNEIRPNAENGGLIVVKKTSSSVSGDVLILFARDGSTRGSISMNGTTAVSYNTTSDYRLKENIAPMTGALSKVALLKPCTYTWKSDGAPGQGFIAHELAEVVPDAVTGEKDAVDENGKIKPQAIDTSFLVATLTAAIQELNAKVAALEARLASDGPSNGGQA